MMSQKNTFLSRLETAARGLASAFEQEANFKIQSLIALAVLVGMFAWNLSAVEKSILVLTILMVLSLELINSQIEKFLDLIEPDHHPRVKVIKDFSAGAVLLAAAGSLAVGLLIFLPHIVA